MKDSLTIEQMELHAYVDGQLSPEARRRVEAYLETHPEARQQIADYQALNAQIKSLYDPVADEPVPVNYIQTRSRWDFWRPLRTLAAAAFMLALGLSIGLYLGAELEVLDVPPTELAGVPHSEDIEHVIEVTAMAYAVYTPEVRHPVEVGADQESYLVEWLSERMGRQIRVPKLDELGMRLIGGRLLASEYGPGGLLMYEDSGGVRIVLYACLSDEPATAFEYAQQDEVSVFYWIDDALSYAVAGKMPRDQLQPLAQAAYQQLAF
jgi:anti-sigma factor RsiW